MIDVFQTKNNKDFEGTQNQNNCRLKFQQTQRQQFFIENSNNNAPR